MTRSRRLPTSFDSAIWSITSYYNPCRYQRRSANFHEFRKALRGPLLAIELSYGNGFELTKGDADILIQISGKSVLWQKERLLNVALGRLPASAVYVAWIDCDVVFHDTSWPTSAVDALQKFDLIQLFERAVDLEPDSTHVSGPMNYTGKSLVASIVSGEPARQRTKHGLAWAGKRSLLEKHKFYDAMIVGGGDSAIAFAACGRFKEYTAATLMNLAQTNHYLQWARPFFDDVQANVGFIPGVLFHYWHGTFANRRHRQRHEGLAGFDFDPYADVAISENGCFVWSTDKPELHRYVRQYFELRNENA